MPLQISFVFAAALRLQEIQLFNLRSTKSIIWQPTNDLKRQLVYPLFSEYGVAKIGIEIDFANPTQSVSLVLLA